MKNTTIIFTVLIATTLGFLSSASAQNLDAKPFAALMQQIESSRFTYRETALVQGFYSIKSCLYTSAEVIVLKNYCFPKKKYPAKGYTIISPKFGIIDLYQENLQELQVQQRDVRVTVFPEPLHEALTAPLASYRVRSLNPILEMFYKRRGPSCWSTNFSRYTEKPEVECNVNNDMISGYKEWATETQNLTASDADWARLITRLERIFRK